MLEHRTTERVREVDVEAPVTIDVSHQFDGERHFSWGKFLWYRAPNATDVEPGATKSKEYRHRDILHRITYRPKDVLRYISPTYGKPFHAVIQCSKDAMRSPSGGWRRVDVGGNAPTLLRLSGWALKELQQNGNGIYRWEDIGIVALKVLLVAPLQFTMLMFPMGSDNARTANWYKGFPAKSWAYPKYARNQLDAAPNGSSEVMWRDQAYDFGGQHTRMLRPRRLVVRHAQGWYVDDALPGMKYVFISYTREHFDPSVKGSCDSLYRIAQQMVDEAGLDAYWLDHLCITQHAGPEQSDDIHRICDVIRGAERVCVALPSLQLPAIRSWGSRMWTMSEALLANNKTHIKFCGSDGATIDKSIIDMADEIWNDDQNGRLLAEHFSGSVDLSRLELFSIGLDALMARTTVKLFAEGDVAYALMGLLNVRPRVNPTDTIFQALARLSLANDSAQLVERMFCMLPDNGYAAPGATANRKFVLKDKLGAKLWDIEPLCQVAGVCENDALILDGCRGASIRWKDIPRIHFVRGGSWKRAFMELALRSGPLWILLALVAGFISGNRGILAIFLIFGFALVLSSPWSIICLYGGKVWGASPWLVGFEGVLPIREVERLTFGNAIGRLSYAPSSSLLADKQDSERIGKGPAWIEEGAPLPHIPAGQRLFTLIDTGTMTVSVFLAEKPPSVALIAGREGGMLRAVLCHYERSTATLHKQSVLRLETPMLDRAELLGWVKVA